MLSVKVLHRTGEVLLHGAHSVISGMLGLLPLEKQITCLHVCLGYCIEFSELGHPCCVQKID